MERDGRDIDSPGEMTMEKMRAAMSVAQFLADKDIKVLPGGTWGVHYAHEKARDDALRGLLEGKILPEQIGEGILRPDGIMYDLRDVQTLGLHGLVGKITDEVDFHKNFDYQGFKQFLFDLQGKNIGLDVATELFNSIGRTQVQSNLFRRLGGTGKKQLKIALYDEARKISESIDEQSRISKLLSLLKMRWMTSKGIISHIELDKFESKISIDIKNLLINWVAVIWTM